MPEKIKNSIPKSCQENWLELNPDEKIRFCTLCQQNIFDVTENKHSNDNCLRSSLTIPNNNRKQRYNLLNKFSDFLINSKLKIRKKN